MKERQILFNSPMVQAVLDGRKTQTRRVILKKRNIPGEPRHYPPDSQIGQFLRIADCPYGVPGDRLWVREAWRIASLPFDEQPAIQYRVDDAIEQCDPFDPAYNWDMKYEAWYERMNEQLLEDCERAGLEVNVNEDMAYTWDWDSIPTRWRPSIHLPRWASRITLEVTGVRVERVQDISEDDAYAEGIEYDVWDQAPVARKYDTEDEWFQTWSDELELGYTNYVDLERLARESFRTLWDSINAKRGYGWDANPWIWVVEFKMREYPE